MKTPKCEKRYGWQPKPSGKGCQRRKSQKEEAYTSSAALSMPSNPEIALKDHQLRVKEKLADKKGLVVFHGTGSGKTLTAINAAEEYGGAVVVTPASLQDNFQKELKKYGAKGTYDVYSYEKFRNSPPDLEGRMLIVDEAHRIKNAGTKSHKAISEAAKDSNKVLLLTATPVQNHPHEIAPLINIAAGEETLPTSKKAFNKEFVKKEYEPWWKNPFMPANVHSIDKPKNLEEFNRRASRYVDHYVPEKEGYPSVVENTVEVTMSKEQANTYRLFEDRLDPMTKYKMKKSLPLSKQESSNLNAFINAQRQISNTPQGFDVGSRKRSPKTIEIADRIQGGEGKALVYSNYLDSGIKDISGELGDRKISHRVYTGALNREEKNTIIKDYNKDKFDVLIVSSSGGEGLDLKKTRQVHVMEPHWNDEKIAQIMGRAIRYKSHEGLPAEKQNVEVYRYVSTYPKNIFGFKSSKLTADQYLSNLSRDKKKLNESFLTAVKKDSAGKPCGSSYISKEKKCGKTSSLNSPVSSVIAGQNTPAMKALRNIQKEKNRIRRNDNESAAIVDLKSGEVVYRGRGGTPTGCNISRADRIKGNSVIHNHPTKIQGGKSCSFSDKDIELACYNQAGEIIATNEQYDYKMSPPAEGWNASFYETKVAPSYRKNLELERANAVNSVKKGELTTNWRGEVENKDFDPYHNIWTRVAEETGMKYEKKMAVKRIDSFVGDSTPKHSKMEEKAGIVLQRAFPFKVLDIKAQAKLPGKIDGMFLGEDKKSYSFDMDIDRGKMSYQLNVFSTPKKYLKKDSKEKTPECNVGTPCKGSRGVGCISRRKKCEQKLNRFSSPAERTELKQLATEDFRSRKQVSVEDELRKKGIRELQVIASKQADISRSHRYTKEQLVTKLADIKRLEETKIGSGSAEDEMRKALNRREKRRKEFLDVSPIKTGGLPLTREEAAQKRAVEQLKARREQAVKRGFSILFPGSSKVIEDFSKAITTEDTVIAGLVAGVVILRAYNSATKEYEENYRKSIDKEGKESVYGDTMVPKARQDIKDFYEEPSLSMTEGVKYADEISDRDLAKAHTVKALDDDSVKEALKDIKEGGNKEDTLPYQVDKFKGRIKNEAKKKVKQAEENLLKQQAKLRTADKLEKDTVARNRPIEEERTRLRDEIARIKKEFPNEADREKATVSIKAPASLKGSETFNKIKQALDKSSGTEDTEVDLRRQALIAQGKLTKNEIEDELSSYALSLRHQAVIDGLKNERKETMTYAQLVKAEDRLRVMLDNNLISHQVALAGKTSTASAFVRDAQDKLDAVEKEWGAIASNTKEGKAALDKKALSEAQAEIARRRTENIATKPLIPDFGDPKGNKLSRYQAWALTNYLEDRRLNKLKANSDIQSNKKKYSLEEFKRQQKGIIVVGSETGKGEEAAAILQRDIPSLKNAYVKGVENDYSLNASMGESEKSFAAYIGRAGKYAGKSIPSGNNIPGVDPTKADNDDATRIAAQIIAMNEYGIPPRVVAQGIGGNVLREAMDIVAVSRDPKALDNTKVAIFGSPRLGLSKYKDVQKRDNVFYGGGDYIAAHFGGKGKERIADVGGMGSYEDYLKSPAVKKKIESIFKS